MNNKLISLLTPLVLGLLATSACNDDVPTEPWLPNYTDSGYGGRAAAGAGGGTTKGDAGASGDAGAAGDAAGSAGEAGAR